MKKEIIAALACLLASQGLQAQETGRLTVDCDQQGATVWVDGVKKGTTPLTLELLGEHNIRVENDINNFYRSTELVDFTPGMDMRRTYTLKEMPAKNYGMLLAQYGTNGEFSFMLGLCRYWGAYIRMHGTLGGESGGSHYGSFLLKNDLPVMKLDNPRIGGASAGLMFRICKYLYTYAGIGYAEYKPGNYTGDGVKEENFSPYEYEFLTMDVGLIAKYKALLFSLGYTPSLKATKASTDNARYGDFQIGIGVSLHKNRKR